MKPSAVPDMDQVDAIAVTMRHQLSFHKLTLADVVLIASAVTERNYFGLACCVFFVSFFVVHFFVTER